MKLRILILSFGLIVPGLCFAGLYKYKDQNGSWVYSQTPPANGDYETLKLPKETRSSRLTGEERNKKLQKAHGVINSDQTKKKEQDDVARVKQEGDAKRAELCKNARKQLQNLQIFRRFKDKNGNEYRLTATQRAEKTRNAERAVTEFCN